MTRIPGSQHLPAAWPAPEGGGPSRQAIPISSLMGDDSPRAREGGLSTIGQSPRVRSSLPGPSNRTGATEPASGHQSQPYATNAPPRANASRISVNSLLNATNPPESGNATRVSVYSLLNHETPGSEIVADATIARLQGTTDARPLVNPERNFVRSIYAKTRISEMDDEWKKRYLARAGLIVPAETDLGSFTASLKPDRRVTEPGRRAVRQLKANGMPQAHIAAIFGWDTRLVNNIVNRPM